MSLVDISPVEAGFYALPISIGVTLYKRTMIPFVTVAGTLYATIMYKVMTTTSNPPPFPPIPTGKTRICVSGFTVNPYTARAHELAHAIAIDPVVGHKYETWYYFDTFAYPSFLKEKRFEGIIPPEMHKKLGTEFVWLEKADGVITPIGNLDHFNVWIKKNVGGRPMDLSNVR
eukprot:PhF_6_TR26578/c0_g1_i2/m.38460